MKRILVKKIPLYFFVIASGLALVIIFHLYGESRAQHVTLKPQAQFVAVAPQAVTQVRMDNYLLIKPLLYTEISDESQNLKSLKDELLFQINRMKSAGFVNEASVYLRKLNDGEWISVNNSVVYSPGSILKIVAAMTYLGMAESNPSLVEKEFLFTQRKRGVPVQTFNETPLVSGKRYKAKDLISQMIINSDNDATEIINANLNIPMFKKLFTDLRIPEPDVQDRNFTMDAESLSKFLRVLYNATYLNKANSEFLLSLLTRSSFNQGIVKSLPPDVVVAHKFGETGTPVEAQLHETAIVYLESGAYLLTIMTRGGKVQKLPEIISELSKTVYEKMKANS